MKIAVVGSRSINDLSLLENVWKKIGLPYKNCSLISGGAIGVDTNAKEFADKYNLEIEEIKPDWNKFGKKAGFKRNHEIIKNCDVCVAIWDGESNGRKNSILLCKNYCKRLYVWNNTPGHRVLYTYKYENTQLELF